MQPVRFTQDTTHTFCKKAASHKVCPCFNTYSCTAPLSAAPALRHHTTSTSISILNLLEPNDWDAKLIWSYPSLSQDLYFVTSYAHIQCPSGYKNIKYKRHFDFFLWQICTACTNCCTQSARAVVIHLTPSQSWLTSSNHQAWLGLAPSAFNGQQVHRSRNLCLATLKKEWVLAICTWDQSILSSSTKAEPAERKPKMSH